MDGAEPTVVAEVTGGVVRRVELNDVPSELPGLPAEGGHEAVDGRCVFKVARQLAAPPPGDVAPGEWSMRVVESGAPAPACETHGGAIAASEQHQSTVGQGEATAGDTAHEAAVLQGTRELRDPWRGNPEKPAPSPPA